jgi:hypothetical protein
MDSSCDFGFMAKAKPAKVRMTRERRLVSERERKRGRCGGNANPSSPNINAATGGQQPLGQRVS